MLPFAELGSGSLTSFQVRLPIESLVHNRFATLALKMIPLYKMAPTLGFEPRTAALTGRSSTTELSRNKMLKKTQFEWIYPQPQPSSILCFQSKAGDRLYSTSEFKQQPITV